MRPLALLRRWIAESGSTGAKPTLNDERSTCHERACSIHPVGGFAASRPRVRRKLEERAGKRGEYLVTTGLCHDCHTPLVMGPDGPGPDMTRALSGHPQDIVVTAPAPRPGAVGPRPRSDPDRMVGALGRELHRQSHARSGNRRAARFHRAAVHPDAAHRAGTRARGGQILPPMPWPLIGQMTDDDLKAVFAYLRQIPPLRNKVPDPIPPAN